MEKLLKKLLESGDKIIQCKEKFLVKHVKLLNDLDLIVLDLMQNNILYKGISMIKGNIFTIPKENQIIFAEKMFFKINLEFQLQLFIEGKIDEKSGKSEQNVVENNNSFSFEFNEIYKTISTLTGEKLPEKSIMISRIIKISQEDLADIISISNCETYKLQLNKQQIKNYKPNDFLLIICFEIKQNIIDTNKMTMFELLSDDRLINYLDSSSLENVKLFQVLDHSKEDIILADSNLIMYKLSKNQSNIKNQFFGFCTTLIISNYNIIDDKIEINGNSFLYQFRNESYYVENIIINLVTGLELHILDYKEDNIFDCISSVAFEDKIISKNIEYILFLSIFSKKYEYYPLQITLSNKKNKEKVSVRFTIYLYPGMMNKINVFINVKLERAYFFEYFYYNLKDDLEEIEKTIYINNMNYNINIYDSFGSKNRKRICVMNVPYQDMEIEEDELNSNSIQVCELRKGKYQKIAGIYDISYNIKDEEIESNYFDDYYEQFGDIYDDILIHNTLNDKKIKENIKNKYNKYKNNKHKSFLDINYYQKTLTLSRFKAWFGLIICEFVYLAYKASKPESEEESKEESEEESDEESDEEFDSDYDINPAINEIIETAQSKLTSIRDAELKYIDIIRIIIFTLIRKTGKNYDSNIKLVLVSELKECSPYLLAYNFNKSQIMNLDEFSALFQAYLQMDSYRAFNYIHSEQSHTFSLELPFMIKTQLLFTYDEFFFITKREDNRYAFIDVKTRITTINELNTLGKDYKENLVAKNPEEAKNYAFPISIDFMHEKGGHYKYSLKNHKDIVPVIYYRGLKAEIEVNTINKKKNILNGESGGIIENFICKDKYILEALMRKHIFGELLDKKYFEGKDFKLLINQIKEILKKHPEKNKTIINTKDKNKIKSDNKRYPNSKKKKKKLYPTLPRFMNCLKYDKKEIEEIKRKMMMTKSEIKEIYETSMKLGKEKINRLINKKSIKK